MAKTTELPRPAKRYAEAAAQMRAIGIQIRDDEYERIDDYTDTQATMFLHLYRIAPFLAQEIANGGPRG